MIFGRGRRDEPVDEEPTNDVEETGDETTASTEGEPDWAALDEQEWRADGPFDIDEVDLDDGVQRLDLGSVIITPSAGSQLRLQVDEKTQQIVSVLVMGNDSGLELALYAAPRSGGQWAEWREEALEAAVAAGGQAGLSVGPFGTELRRIMPAKTPDGQDAVQPSRSFGVEGPRWMLRGTLLGAAAMTEDEEGAAGEFLDLYRNVIVRRGDAPMAPGEVLAMKLPDSWAPQG